MIMIIVVCLALSMPGPTNAQARSEQPESRISATFATICTLGPVHRKFGDTEWLLYTCKGDDSLLIVPAPGIPLAPSAMLAFPFEYGGYRLLGPDPASDDPRAAAARDALAETSGGELRALAAEARAITKPDARPR